jgi:hypothetical protein
VALSNTKNVELVFGNGDCDVVSARTWTTHIFHSLESKSPVKAYFEVLRIALGMDLRVAAVSTFAFSLCRGQISSVAALTALEREDEIIMSFISIVESFSVQIEPLTWC